MSLAVGSRLGPYEVTAKIGEGGMGEVDKATDTRLDRTVTIKVLPEHVRRALCTQILLFVEQVCSSAPVPGTCPREGVIPPDNDLKPNPRRSVWPGTNVALSGLVSRKDDHGGGDDSWIAIIVGCWTYRSRRVATSTGLCGCLGERLCRQGLRWIDWQGLVRGG